VIGPLSFNESLNLLKCSCNLALILNIFNLVVVFIHDRADAPVMGHLWEHFLCGDLVVGYDSYDPLALPLAKTTHIIGNHPFN